VVAVTRFNDRMFGVVVLASVVVALLALLLWITRSQPSSEPAAAPILADSGGPVALHPEIGHDYTVRLYSQCGIEVAQFAGRRWKAERSIGSPVEVSGDNSTPGVVRLLDADTLLFTASGRDLVVVFRATTEPPRACD
jgi:hypothetical protein